MVSSEQTIRDRIVAVLSSLGRVSDHAGEETPDGVQADLTNLRAAVRELQQAVVALAEELDKRA